MKAADDRSLLPRARRIGVRLGQLYLDALRRMDLTTKIPGYVSHKPVSRRTPRG